MVIVIASIKLETTFISKVTILIMDHPLLSGFGVEGRPGLTPGLFHLKPLVASQETCPTPSAETGTQSGSAFSALFLSLQTRAFHNLVGCDLVISKILLFVIAAC